MKNNVEISIDATQSKKKYISLIFHLIFAGSEFKITNDQQVNTYKENIKKKIKEFVIEDATAI